MAVIERFFVLEGLDGAGTTTQLNLLKARCNREKLDVEFSAEPTDRPIGRLIRSVLRGDLSVSPRTLAHMFAADRSDHLDAPDTGIRACVAAGRSVVIDRYVFSSLAYQSVECGFEYVARLNDRFPLPKAVFYLEVSTQTAMKRSEDRDVIEIFENRPFQDAVRESYEKALSWAQGSGVDVRRIDGARTPELIHHEIWEYLSEQFAR